MTPNIYIAKKDLGLELHLLKRVHEYYPIGLPEANEDYAGHHILKEKLESKINGIINNAIPADFINLKKGIEDAFQNTELRVLDEYHTQFPSYALSIELFKEKYNTITVTDSIKVNTSLLTNHFTLFYDQTILSSCYSAVVNQQLPVFSTIISSHNNLDKGRHYYDILINLITKHLPSYIYADCQKLFTCLIRGGTPFGMDNLTDKNYPIFAYLFGNEYNYIDYKLVL